MTKAAPSPIRAKERITSIDTLRGFALLGILIMNVQAFAMVEAAYFNPSLHMDLTGINWWVWALSHALADSKFMAIFSMLFGAGIIVLTQRREAAGEPTWGLHARRNTWLLVFGMIHAYLIWYGDILVSYALSAFVVYWFRNFSVRSLLIIGTLFLAVAPALSLASSWSLQFAPEDVRLDVISDFVPTENEIAEEIAAYQGSWLDAHGARIATAAGLQLAAFPFFLFWRAAGLMLVGMALFKLGIFSAGRSATFYNRMIAVGLIVGLPLVTLSVIRNAAEAWEPLYSFLGPGMLYNYWGSLGIAAAYIGIVMRIAQSGVFPALQARLAAVGQTAFTNYIAQSVICTTLFYGFGLGLFGSVERWGQVLIVLAVWTLQLAIAPLWLRYYRFGPLEWAWRSLTYWSLQPMRR